MYDRMTYQQMASMYERLIGVTDILKLELKGECHMNWHIAEAPSI